MLSWQSTTGRHVLADSQAAAAAARAKAAGRMKAEGITVIYPTTRWPTTWWRHRLVDEHDVAQARQAGTLAARIHADGDVDYYTTETPSAREEPGSRQIREHDRAIQSRGPACAALAQAGPPPMPSGPAQAVTDTLAQAILHSADADSAHLAHTWLHPYLAGTERTHSDHDSWRSQLLAAGNTPADQKARISAAYALALAQDEEITRWTYSSWGTREIAHLERLQSAGYEPTDWENHCLASARAKTTDPGAPEGHGYASPTTGPPIRLTVRSDLDLPLRAQVGEGAKPPEAGVRTAHDRRRYRRDHRRSRLLGSV